MAYVKNIKEFWNQSLVALGATGTAASATNVRDYWQKFVDALTTGIVKATGAQTIAGVKTFSSMYKIPINTPVAGAGSVIGDAAPVQTGFTVITGANGTLGWLLPVTTGGDTIILKGTTAGVAKVWPQTGAQINAVGASTAYSLTTGAMPITLISTSATQWYTLPLVAS